MPNTAGEKEEVSCRRGPLTRVTKGKLAFSKSGELKIQIQYFIEPSTIPTSGLALSCRMLIIRLSLPGLWPHEGKFWIPLTFSQCSFLQLRTVYQALRYQNLSDKVPAPKCYGTSEGHKRIGKWVTTRQHWQRNDPRMSPAPGPMFMQKRC